MSDPTNSTQRDLAFKRLKAKRAFNAQLAAYVIVNVFLWCLWAITRNEAGGNTVPPWPIWVTLGWGIGVAFSAWGVYGSKPITDADIDKEMHKSD